MRAPWPLLFSALAFSALALLPAGCSGATTDGGDESEDQAEDEEESGSGAAGTAAASSGAASNDAAGSGAARSDATGSGATGTKTPAAEPDDARSVSGGREAVRETLVVVRPLVVGPIRDEVVVSAKVESRFSVQVFPKLSGLPITAVAVEEGDRVAPGDVLMRLFATELDLALAQTRASFDQARKEVERQELQLAEEEARVVRAERQATKAAGDHRRLADLVADGVVNQKEVEDALLLAETAQDDLELSRFARDGTRLDLDLMRLRVTASEIEVARAASNLEHATLRAPLAGVVAERSVEVGELSSLSMPAFRIVDTNKPVLNLRVPQDALAQLSPGQAVEARAVTDSSLLFHGIVRTVNPVLDLVTGTIHVIVDLTPEATLVPGLFCEARIVTAARDEAVLVDKRAVRYEDEQPVFFALQEDGVSVSMVPFVAGATTATSIEVVSDVAGQPLSAALQVVVVGNESLRDGSRVKVREEPY